MGCFNEDMTLSRLQICDLLGRFRLAVEMDVGTIKMFEINKVCDG